MEYLKTSLTGVYIQFDPSSKTATVLDKAELQKILEFNQTQLASLPAVPKDSELLVWAKKNYPQVEGITTSKTLIEENITKLQEQINACK